MSDSVQLYRRQPTRLPCPWDFPGKNTGVGCHFLRQCMKEKSESEVSQSCPTLSGPMNCSLPGSSIHGIFQARVLEWGAIAFSAWHKKTLQKCLNNGTCFLSYNQRPGWGESRYPNWQLASPRWSGSWLHQPAQLSALLNLLQIAFLKNQYWSTVSFVWSIQGIICMCVCSFAKSCLTLCDPMGCSPPGSSVHGISQARILEWVAISFSRGSSQSMNQTHVSSIGRRILYQWATREAPIGTHTRCSINATLFLLFPL